MHVDPAENDPTATARAEERASLPRRLYDAALARRLPLAMVALNVSGAAALVYLVGRHGVSRTDLAVFATSYLLGVVGIELGMHRLFSHRSYVATPRLRAVLAVLGTMGGQGSPVVWATTHRKHHHFADRDGDPHSPRARGMGARAALRGFWHAHFAWHFRAADAIDLRDLHRYGRDLVTDPMLRSVDRHAWSWVALGLALPAAAGLAVTGTVDGAVTAFFWGGPIRILCIDNVLWTVNSLGHTSGRRPFATRDRSSNLAWLVPFSLGAGWHNNHHAYPASACTALSRAQVDPGFWCLRALVALRLAHSLVRPHADDAGGTARRDGDERPISS